MKTPMMNVIIFGMMENMVTTGVITKKNTQMPRKDY